MGGFLGKGATGKPVIDFLAKQMIADIGQGFDWNGKIVLVGSSTGGVKAINTLLSGFPRNCPPTLICQHMPAKYLRRFAIGLNDQIPAEVSLAKTGEQLMQGHIYIAPGGNTHLEICGGSFRECFLDKGKKVNGHRPSVDTLFNSAIEIANNVVAVLLTGMGKDGAQGLLALRNSGALTIGQGESSCAVYGMPRAARELDAIMYHTALPDISGVILKFCTSGFSKSNLDI